METPSRSERLDSVQLPVRDLRQSIEWYTQTLGLTLRDGPHEDLAFLAHPDPEGPLIALWQTPVGTHSHFLYQGKPKPSVLFRTTTLKAIYERLRAAGATIDQQPESWDYQRDENAKFLFFYDLNENYLGLIELRASA